MRDHRAAVTAGIAEWRQRTNDRVQSTPDEHATAVVEAALLAYDGYQRHDTGQLTVGETRRRPEPLDDRPVLVRIEGGPLLAGVLRNGRQAGPGVTEYDFIPLPPGVTDVQ